MLPSFGMGGLAPRVATLALVALAFSGCVRAHDHAEECQHALEAKLDAVSACSSAYGEKASVANAKAIVNAYLARGDETLSRLAALHPIDPIGAEIWHKRAGRFRDAGNTDESIRNYERALALRGEDLEGQVRELAALSERYDARGDVRHSLEIQARAFETATKLGDPIILAHVRVALAIELSNVGDESGAERVLADSVDRLANDDSYLPPALIMVGSNHLYHHRPKLARIALERVLSLADEQAVHDAHRGLIDVAIALGDLSEAKRLIETDFKKSGPGHEIFVAQLAMKEGRLADAQRSIQLALASPDLPAADRPQVETMEGELLAKQGDGRAAVAPLMRAIETFEKELDSLGIDELKAWAQRDAQRRAPFEHLFAIHARAGRALEAFTVAQRATARAYLDGLASRDHVAPTDIAALTSAAGARAEALHLISRSLRTSAATKAPTPEELRLSLAGSIVWTYFVADGDVWLASLDHGEASVDLLGTLESMQSTIAAASNLDKDALATLDGLLAPHRRWAHLTSSSVVHLVAGPPFDRIPFAALGNDSNRWVNRAAWTYVPSAVVLARLSRTESSDGTFVVLGDPTGDLPGAREEAQSTARRFHTRARVGADASADSVLAASRSALLDIASHADATPGGASLRLATGMITTSDIVDRGLAPRLVVLASCASAAVDVDAWGALAGAFIAAGSPNVIASRWTLDDTVGRDLLDHFYDADGFHHPALALAIAQRAAITHQVPVAAWASLVALGTGETLDEQQRGKR